MHVPAFYPRNRVYLWITGAEDAEDEEDDDVGSFYCLHTVSARLRVVSLPHVTHTLSFRSFPSTIDIYT